MPSRRYGERCHQEDETRKSRSTIRSNKINIRSGVLIVEMIKEGGRGTIPAISELVNLIIYEENIPEGWKDSFIINCYKGKGDATDRGNYRGLKLLEHVMKILECVLESLIRSQVDINKCSLVLYLGAALQMRYISFDKWRSNTLLGRRKSTSLLLT